MTTTVRAWLSVALLLVGVYGSYTFWRAYQAHAADGREGAAEADASEAVAKPAKSTALPPVPLDEFTFTDENGEPFEMKSLQGKVWAASYFFATCPGFCLQMNYGIAGIAEDLEDEDITFVSFTVDPETDKPEDLKAYAKKLEADPKRWKFLTGPAEQIQKLGQGSLKMPATKEHNDKLVLVGADGRVVGWYSTRDTNKVRQFKRKVLELFDAGEKTEDGQQKSAKPAEAGEAS
ncbi:MAG TPA: SCO family protein [Pirellulales bacterium]|nr:SCO family protein [Pirellulales bacterium]